MGKQDRFTDEFKRDAVAQVVDRGYPVREVAERLRISTGLVAVWCRSFDSILCSKGDELWDKHGRTNFGRMRCGSP